MSGHLSVHSDLWHRVGALKLRIKPETTVERQIVRGQVWYVAGDRFSTRAFRFTPAVYAVLMRMNGQRSLDAIWRDVSARMGADAPAQDQILGVVSQLYGAELIGSDQPVDADEIAERADKHARRLATQRFRNPMFLRLPLLDPDRFLSATVHLVRPFCNPLGACLWVAAMAWFLAEAGLHWGELSADVTDRVLAADNILVFLIVFPPLKILHELGHAYAVKLFGGPVHEIGISFLTFMPAPYVDASASALFPHGWQRALVGAAGMMVELSVAAAALAVWLQAEPGLVRSVAYDVVFIAAVSTVVFNANPLLRFDGYYILGDLFGLPNLAGRASRLYLAIAQRNLFGLTQVQAPQVAPRERLWLLVYGPASLIYRLVVVSGVALFVGTQYFVFGVALVAWMLVSTIVLPVLKALHYVLLSPALGGHRLRAIVITGGGAAALVAAVTVLPVPYGTVVEGVVWLPDDARLVAAESGEVVRFLAEPGGTVRAGDPLLALADPYLASRRRAAEARLAELTARETAAEPTSPFDLAAIRHQIAFAQDDLAEITRREAALVGKSPSDGTFLVPRAEDLIGSYVKRGQLIGYVMSGEMSVVRAVVPEDEIDLVRSRLRGVTVRLEGARGEPDQSARVSREFPAATRHLPNPALALANGGPLALDPSDKDGATSLLPFFAVDLAVASDLVRDHWGERAWIRFDHGASPVAERWYRAARQVFLGRFHV